MDKSPDAFRTISEVAEDLDLPQHVLRFWETRFGQIRPLKRGGGRRYYRPDDVDLLKGIRHLLYGQGYTIRGVQRILKEQGVRTVQALGRGEIAVPRPSPGSTRAEAERDAEAPGETVDEGDDEVVIAEAEGIDGAEDGEEDESEQEGEEAPLARPARPACPAPAPVQRPMRAETMLAREDAARLRDALGELEECRRLLAAAREPAQANSVS